MTADDLPEGGPTEAVDTDLEDQDMAFQTIVAAIDPWLLMEQLNGTEPLVAASKLLQVLTDVLVEAMGLGAVRAALLMVYEKTYDDPMTGMQRIEAGKMLDRISHARRTVEGKSSLILPGGDVR